MRITTKPEPKISEFDTVPDKDNYELWLAEKVKQARLSPRLYRDEAQAITQKVLSG